MAPWTTKLYYWIWKQEQPEGGMTTNWNLIHEVGVQKRIPELIKQVAEGAFLIISRELNA